MLDTLAALLAVLDLADAAQTIGAMNLLVAAQSGWGKSFKGQHVMEKNLPEYDHVVVLDFKDEFRGLCKAGLASWWIAGPREREWSRSAWRQFFGANPKVVLARHTDLGVEEWQAVAATVVAAARDLGDVLIIIDEAHFVAPQTGSVPKVIEGLATTGRGEGASSVWITQRPAKTEETVLSQCQARLLGGFESDADLSKVEGIVEYPKELHNPQVNVAGTVPEELLPEGRETPQSLQKHENDAEEVIGSEWIYSDSTGARERQSTLGLAEEMQTTHHGKQGKKVRV